MNYTTQYYKNLCENLQLEIMLLEAGLKKALKSGNPKLMKKELAKRRERSNRLKSEAGRLNKLPKNRGALAAMAGSRALDPDMVKLIGQVTGGDSPVGGALVMANQVNSGLSSNCTDITLTGFP